MQEEGRKGLINTCWREKTENTIGLFILDWISYSIMLDCAHQQQKFMVTFSYIHTVQQHYRAFFQN